MKIVMLHVLFALWITTAADKHSGFVIFIAFALQNWLHERA
jgi:hypothetical protein